MSTKDGNDINSLANANRQVGFEGRLKPGKRPALLVVDFVNAYVMPGSPLYAGVEHVQLACARLLALCRARGIMVVHTHVAYQAQGSDGGVFFRKVPALRCFEKGVSPELAAFAEGLKPQNHELVITKQYASAFFGTALASTLTAHGIDTVLIAGVSTSGCVRATAVDCCQHGFIPLVVQEAVGDRGPAQHDASLFDIQTKYGEVISIDEVDAYLANLTPS